MSTGSSAPPVGERPVRDAKAEGRAIDDQNSTALRRAMGV